MELIDRKALINQLNEENIPFNADINEIINNQPTAFDTEKVVEQLEERKDKRVGILRHVLEEAIDIVKKGGVE